MLMFFALPPSSHDTPQETVTKLGTLKKTNQKEKKENQENQENQKKHDDDEKMTPILKPS